MSKYLREALVIEYYALGTVKPLLNICVLSHIVLPLEHITSWFICDANDGDIPTVSGGKKHKPELV